MNSLLSGLLSGASSFLGSIQTYLIVGAVTAVVSFGGGFYLEHRLADSTIANMETANANAVTKAVQLAKDYQAGQDKTVLASALAEATAQTQIVTKTVTLTKEIPVYVTPAQDAAPCGITVGFVRVLRAAAAGTDPGSLALAAGQSDDACADVTPSTLASWFAGYAGASIANAEQLNALEADVRAQHGAPQ